MTLLAGRGVSIRHLTPVVADPTELGLSTSRWNRHVLAHGDAVMLAARRTEAMRTLDVADAEQRVRAISETERMLGSHLDILVNNAGIDFPGGIEDQREQDYRQTLEVNSLFGTLEMLRAALPGMRERGTGMIVNMSSLDGQTPNGYYSSSKSALEGGTEALW